MARKIIPFICLFGEFIFPSAVWTYRNLALNKAAWQKHPYKEGKFPASLAVDGRKSNLSIWGGECAVSDFIREAEWRVDLGEMLSIHHIYLQYVSNTPVWDEDNYKTKSFLGFSVYLSNTTEKEDGILCFKDTNYTRATIPNPTNITCPYHGRYVIYYNNRTHPPLPDGYSTYAYTDLCEVEVYGCPTQGHFGPNCSSRCHRNCQEGHCDIMKGTCLGCIAGYTGALCDEECKPFKYGVECKRSCGNCSDGQQCNHVNGSCPNGCDVGLQGDKCDIACASGWYGENCKNKCGIHCKSCNRFDGQCEFGCHPGWKGQSCEKACDGGNFGQDCTEACGMCIEKQQCHHINGTCLNRCDRGYQGIKCTEECEVGFFGHNCKNPCSRNCINAGECNRVNGQCKGGCQPGWKGSTCRKECDGGNFGQNCNESCGLCQGKEQCHHINGTCLRGCDSGYSGIKCTQECAVGLFGNNCEEFCGSHCLVPGRCDRVTGHCQGGCQPGWKGSDCREECGGGNFGKNCTESCGMCLGKEQCHHINGTCLKGCIRGYQGTKCTEECEMGLFGYNCQEVCSRNCLDPVKCNRVTGECEGGCQSGWKGSKCRTGCDGGNFGQNCTQLCGMCRGKEHCHHINGTCLHGCDRGYQGIMCTEGLPEDQKSSRTIMFIVLAITITVIFGFALLITIKRIRMKKKLNWVKKTVKKWLYYMMRTVLLINTHETSVTTFLYTESSELSLTKSTGLNSGDDIQMDREILSDITIGELQHVLMEIKENEVNEESFLKRDYIMLPCGEQFTCYAGKSKENLFKNRYKTILPYDHSRVILREKYDPSDYINANYIKGVNGENSYIATQGPTKKTLKSFWAMICQENVSQIVMLTELSEGGKIKCTQYWPKCLKEMIYGNYVIKNIEENQHAIYTIRRLIISNTKHQSSRVVTQYHYTMWPDHGTPDPLCLVVFHRHVLRTRGDDDESPCVVHCSAGVGRTGTYIALDALYKEGKMTGKINVAEYVKVMRSCRMNLVQTYEQYEMLFFALAEEFKASVETQSLTDFMENTSSLDEDNAIYHTTLQKEFEDLMQIIPEYSNDDYKEARQHALNKDTVLPLDKFLLYLTSSVKNRGSFINAIHVSSYVQNNAFIITHYPTPEGAVDFLRLLTDHESDTVICMDPLAEIESSKAWLPERSSSTAVSSFRVKSTGQNETDVKMNNISIINEKRHKHHAVIVEPQKPVQSSGNFQDTSSIRSLVSYAIEMSAGKPITIVSKDGASLCGVFCAVFNSIQQIRMDGSVDVFTTVRQLQTRRPEFCSTLEEYIIVHRALRDYIGTISEKVYYNQ